MKLSIILPIYNEEGSIKRLYGEIKEVLSKYSYDYEIITIDDGSTDKSPEILKQIANQDDSFKFIQLSRNFGQTTALSAGFDNASGEIIIPMDADLQNDPADIPKFIKKIEEGYDLVSGWRKDRQDNFLRRLPSLIANALISFITGMNIHDHGCTMKAYRKEIVKGVHFYGEMHRFVSVYVSWNGAKISEIIVNHRPRKFDKSKYGISRVFPVILDLLAVKFLVTYLTKPMHFFGSVGLLSVFLGFLGTFWAIFLRFAGVHFSRTPLPTVIVFLFAIGIQFIFMGILAEILTRIYHEPDGRKTYRIGFKKNIKDEQS